MTARRLTPRQADVLRALEVHQAQHGYLPTYRELSKLLGLDGVSAAHAHVAALEAAGLVRRTPGAARGLVLAGGLRDKAQAALDALRAGRVGEAMRLLQDGLGGEAPATPSPTGGAGDTEGEKR